MGPINSVVWDQRDDEPRTDGGVKITDSGRISKLLRLVEARNSKWKRPLFAPIFVGKHTLAFRGKEDQLMLVLWMGETGIAGRNGGDDTNGSRSRSISVKHSEEIVAVLQGAKES